MIKQNDRGYKAECESYRKELEIQCAEHMQTKAVLEEANRRINRLEKELVLLRGKVDAFEFCVARGREQR